MANILLHPTCTRYPELLLTEVTESQHGDNSLTVTQTVWMQACTQAQDLDKLQRVKTGRNLLPIPS